VKNRIQAGFTLVELIVVIVILGILAAVALPKFMGLEREARVAAVKSMGGTLLSAANMARGVCMAQNCTNGGVGITIDGQQIIFANGFPNNATVNRLLQSYEGFTPGAAGNRMVKQGSATVNCWVQYNAPTVAGRSPTISYQSGTITNAQTETAVNAALRVAC
jgi:MSHA pilin protein MshA